MHIIGTEHLSPKAKRGSGVLLENSWLHYWYDLVTEFSLLIIPTCIVGLVNWKKKQNIETEVFGSKHEQRSLVCS